jgi:hypothetical protein
MIAKKKTLIVNCLENSSLQVSLQSCQLSTSTSLLVQAVSVSFWKEQTVINQRIHPNIFASLFASNPN